MKRKVTSWQGFILQLSHASVIVQLNPHNLRTVRRFSEIQHVTKDAQVKRDPLTRSRLSMEPFSPEYIKRLSPSISPSEQVHGLGFHATDRCAQGDQLIDCNHFQSITSSARAPLFHLRKRVKFSMGKLIRLELFSKSVAYHINA